MIIIIFSNPRLSVNMYINFEKAIKDAEFQIYFSVEFYLIFLDLNSYYSPFSSFALYLSFELIGLLGNVMGGVNYSYLVIPYNSTVTLIAL